MTPPPTSCSSIPTSSASTATTTAWPSAWSRRSRPRGSLDKVAVFGTDGISDAYASIKAGELTGTVDSFPVLTGEVAMETALRLVSGQNLPRVVSTPQALITKDNVARYQDAGDNLRAVLIEDEKK